MMGAGDWQTVGKPGAAGATRSLGTAMAGQWWPGGNRQFGRREKVIGFPYFEGRTGQTRGGGRGGREEASGVSESPACGTGLDSGYQERRWGEGQVEEGNYNSKFTAGRLKLRSCTLEFVSRSLYPVETEAKTCVRIPAPPLPVEWFTLPALEFSVNEDTSSFLKSFLVAVCLSEFNQIMDA